MVRQVARKTTGEVLPPPAEMPYGEIQKMMALAPTYGFEFVPPKL